MSKKTTDRKVIENSLDLSTEWALRSKKSFGVNPHKGLFGIVQGGLFDDLKKNPKRSNRYWI